MFRIGRILNASCSGVFNYRNVSTKCKQIVYQRTLFCSLQLQKLEVRSSSLRSPLNTDTRCMSSGKPPEHNNSLSHPENNGSTQTIQPKAGPSSREPKDYPTHYIVFLSTLSPIMKNPNKPQILKEGDEVILENIIKGYESDGDCDYDTSKGFLAKINKLPLINPLCVVVPDKADVGAFADYAVDNADLEEAQKNIPFFDRCREIPVPPEAQVTSSARRLANERCINILAVTGTGYKGIVNADDVRRYITSLSVIAKRLILYKQTLPYYYLSADICMDEIIRLGKESSETPAEENVKLSFNDLIIKASALAFTEVPEANSSWLETFIRQFNAADINVAFATDTGLITPIIFYLHNKLSSVNDIRCHHLASTNALEVIALAEKAKVEKLKPEEFQEGTFTISNFSAFIAPNQACILVAYTEERPVPDDNSNLGYKAASIMSVTLIYDHRVIDRTVVAKWLNQLKKFLENPDTMLP